MRGTRPHLHVSTLFFPILSRLLKPISNITDSLSGFVGLLGAVAPNAYPLYMLSQFVSLRNLQNAQRDFWLRLHI